MPKKDENLGTNAFGDWPRFHWLDTQLRRNLYPSAPKLAAQFGLSPKAAQGVIERFETQLNAPIAYAPARHGYHYVGNAIALPPLWLQEPEASSLLIALAMQQQNLAEQVPEIQKACQALLPGRYARLGERVLVESFENHPPHAETFSQAALALVEERCLAIVYAGKNDDQVTERTIEPWMLHHFAGNWFLLAYCRHRQAPRLFALDRIQALDLKEKFDPPEPEVPQAFLRRAFGIYKTGDLRTARIRFTPHITRWVREQIWHPQQQMTPLPDGGLELTLPIAGGAFDLVREIAKFGPDAELLEPADLREQVVERLREALERYTAKEI